MYGLVIVLMFSTAVNIALYNFNSNKITNTQKCDAQYRIADGLARDERATRQRADTQQELDTWENFLKLSLDSVNEVDPEETDAQRKRFIRTMRDRIKSLKATLRTQVQYPYPSPDACADGTMTPEEGLPE